MSQRYRRSGDDNSSYRSGLQIGLDARDNTEYGLVRTVARVDAMYRTGDAAGMGALRSGSARRSGLATTGDNGYGFMGNPNGAGAQDYIEVMGYVQVGGLTAGRLQSAYTFAGPAGGQAVGYMGVIGGDSPFMQNQIGYTLSAGNGVTATVSIEDPTNRRMGIASVNTAGATDRTNTGAAVSADQYIAGVGYGANRVPDVVGNVTVAQSWGQLKVSGAYHEVISGAPDIGAKAGFAGQIGIKLAADMIAKGDAFYAQAGYSVGANSYLWNGLTSSQPGVAASQPTVNGTAVNATGNNGLGYGNVAATLADGVVDQDRKLTLSKSMGVSAAFDHYWVPTVHSWVAGSYTAINWSSKVRNTEFLSGAAIGSTTATVANVDPAKHYMVSVGTEWNPIKGLAIGTEVSYAKLTLKDAAPGIGNGGVANASDPTAGDKKTQDIWGVRFRVKRDF